MSFRNILLAGMAFAALAACGHTSARSSTSNGIMTNSTANPSPSSVAMGPMGGMSRHGEPMAPGTLATVPPGLTCGAVRAVWVNTKTHVYHEPNDPYYGRTRHGEYLCPADAKAKGYRPAGKHHHHKRR